MILKFFLFYALVCLIIFSVAGLGLFIGYCCASSRDRHFIRERPSYSQMHETISAARAQCKKLQNDLQNNKSRFTIYEELSAIQESLTFPKPELTNQYKKLLCFYTLEYP